MRRTTGALAGAPTSHAWTCAIWTSPARRTWTSWRPGLTHGRPSSCFRPPVRPGGRPTG
jgi:hypothetical protein